MHPKHPATLHLVAIGAFALLGLASTFYWAAIGFPPYAAFSLLATFVAAVAAVTLLGVSALVRPIAAQQLAAESAGRPTELLVPAGADWQQRHG